MRGTRMAMGPRIRERDVPEDGWSVVRHATDL